MGDFNADPYKYHQLLAQGRTPSPFYKLIAFLTNRNFIDQSPRDASGKEYATFIAHNNIPTSRIDLLWFPESMLSSTFCFDQIWTLPSTKLTTNAAAKLDHCCIIGYFNKNLLLGHMPLHRLKQKQEWRTIFDYKHCTEALWKDFQDEIDNKLEINMSTCQSPPKSTLHPDSKRLNMYWQTFMDTVLQAANKTLPKKRHNPNYKDDTPEELIIIRHHLTTLNKVFAFIIRILYLRTINNNTCFSLFQNKWASLRKKPGLKQQLIDIMDQFKFTIDTDRIPTTVSNSSLRKFKELLPSIAALRNIVRAKRALKEQSHSNEMIQHYEDLRCKNYATNKAAFISSSLNRSKRSIVLDRAMDTTFAHSPSLETDPIKVKKLVNNHFKNIAGIPPSTPTTLDNMSDDWQLEYLPQHDIDPSIYDDLLSPPSDEEWKNTISSLPNGSAAGISGISYELIKHLPEYASSFLKKLVTTCFTTSRIPSQWKDATIYPIPKPQDWNCFLSNTRPITLLDTARKIMTKIMNKRLSAVLANNYILKGNNHAGLPGSSCDAPIAKLEAILQDAHTFNKPLFVFLQDISKAFDSIDTRMLRLALDRIKVPKQFTDLVINLFTDRYNTVITSFGPTIPYKTAIGINQGDSLSPLLWVIYLDPLLCQLQKTARSPYLINNDPDVPSVSTSTLAFMDDTTLISSSIEGLTSMLFTAQEFYNMNNTKINFDKASLICNRDPSDISRELTSSPIAYRFLSHNIDFNCTPITCNTSFRFLGVWFTLTPNNKFVKQQCKTEYQLFSNKLRNKRLTSDQLKYLHNAVLLPKVSYRLKCTTLNERECSTIMKPFRSLLKKTLSLVTSIPNCLIRFRNALGITDLYQQHIINHTTAFNNILNANNQLTNMIFHRLSQIATAANLPCSPLSVRNFTALSKLKLAKTDYIFNFLLLSSSLGIVFTRPLRSLQSVDATTIFSLFHDNPSLYAKSLHMIKRARITYLHQCVSADNSSLLPYREMFSRNSDANPGTCTPYWYQHIMAKVAYNNSLRILDDFIPNDFSTQNQLSLPFNRVSVPERNIRAAFWCASWSSTNNAPILGKAFYTDRNSFRFQHWSPQLAIAGPDRSLTPRSRQLTLTECPGCPLDNSSTDTTRSTNSHYFNQFPCRICLPHDEVVKLNVLPKKKFSRDLPMEFNTTLTNITSDINACFTISTEHTSFPQLLSSVFDHGKAQLSFASNGTTTLTTVTKDA